MISGKKLIWILEDDEGSRFVYEEILGLRHTLRMFERVGSFLEALESLGPDQKPDLIVADLRLPDESFLSLLRKDSTRALLSKFAFLVVSSVDDIDILRMCFQEGALDYITKPFGKNEFLIKVERLLERQNVEEGSGCKIDPITMTVSNHENCSVSLTSKEFQILTLMKREMNLTVSREDIVSKIWNQVVVNSKTIDIHIFNLRKKLTLLGISIEFHPPNHYTLSHKRMDP